MFALELAASALTCLLLAQRVAGSDRRSLLRWGLAAVVAGTLANAMASGFVSVGASRMLVGVGAGAVQAVMYATIASSNNAERGYAVISAAGLFWGPPAVLGSTWVLQRFGLATFLMQFAIMAVLALALSGAMPRHASAGHAGDDAARVTRRLDRLSITLLLCVALVLLGHQALWVYQERVGRAIGLTHEQIGLALAAALICGGIGSVAAALSGPKLGRWMPQLIGFGGSIVATLTMVYGTGLGTYVVSACAVMAVWFFGLPYLLAVTAEIDASGRLSALAASAMALGQALAPAAAAAVVGDGQLRHVGWLASAVYVICLVLVGQVLSRLPACRPIPSLACAKTITPH